MYKKTTLMYKVIYGQTAILYKTQTHVIILTSTEHIRFFKNQHTGIQKLIG